MPVYYYPSGQYPTSTTQQYRPIASVQYNAQRSQQIPQTAQQAGIYICYSFLHLLTAPFAYETYWLCFNCELKNSGESWLLFSLKICWKLRNSLLGDTKQWKNGDCILHHCCPVCSAISLVFHMTGAQGEHKQSQYIFKARFYLSSFKLHKAFVKWHVSAPCQRSVAAQTKLVLGCVCLGCALPSSAVPGPGKQWGGPWGWGQREQFYRNVRLEGGPLHCKRVSSRSHSEPVSFPAVSCYSWWHQSKRDIGRDG